MPFTDILAANSAYAADHEELANGRARRGLAIVTCIDTRIDPLEAFGLIPGDAKVIRNAGARVTDDVLRTLIIASHVLGVNRIALIQHTDCGIANNTQESLTGIVEAQTGESVGDLDFLAIDDQISTLHADSAKIRQCSLLPEGMEVGEFIFDVHSGKLTPAT
ncbi:MAG: carbonic anhydrase [Thermoleophilaceae bacterium]|nr:carbonic anhydrase [Thermoleophilaceae bacterium]